MGVPITECQLQRIAREVLDKCDMLDIKSPRARAEAVATKLANSEVAGGRSAARLVERIVDASAG